MDNIYIKDIVGVKSDTSREATEDSLLASRPEDEESSFKSGGGGIRARQNAASSSRTRGTPKTPAWTSVRWIVGGPSCEKADSTSFRRASTDGRLRIRVSLRRQNPATKNRAVDGENEDIQASNPLLKKRIASFSSSSWESAFIAALSAVRAPFRSIIFRKLSLKDDFLLFLEADGYSILISFTFFLICSGIWFRCFSRIERGEL